MISSSDIHNAKVLIVDDREANVRLLDRMLRGAGYASIASTMDPHEVCELHRKNPYDLILLDLVMPGMDGFQVMEGLKEIEKDGYLPVLVITAQPEHKLRALKAGAKDFVSKPLDLAEVLTRVYNMLEVRLLHLETRRLYDQVVAEQKQAEAHLVDRKIMEEALFVEKERVQVTLDSIGDAVLSTDAAGNVTYLNSVAEKMTGWSREEARGRPLGEVFRVVDGTTREPPARSPMGLAIEQNKPVDLAANSVLVRRDGFESAIEDSVALIHSRDGSVIGAVMVFHDASEARAVALKVSHLAQHDFLTDLPNPVLLNDRIAQAIALARRYGKQLAVLFLDLDHFKRINDTLGHATGDKLLQSVALRLKACVRSSDTVSRKGGDEFVVLLSEIAHAEHAARSADKIIAAVTAAHQVAGHELIVTASIGISLYPLDGADAETLLQSADAAMYQAKKNGRNHYCFFRQEMNPSAVLSSSPGP